MSDYLGDLLSRSFGPAESIRPRLPSAFEPSPYVDADTTSPPESRLQVGALAPEQHEPASAENVNFDLRAEETAVPPPVTRSGGLETIVPDPAFRETDKSFVHAPLEMRPAHADPRPMPRKDEAEARSVPPTRAPAPRDGKTSLSPRERPPAAGRREPSTVPIQSSGQTAASERPVRTKEEPEAPSVAPGRARAPRDGETSSGERSPAAGQWAPSVVPMPHSDQMDTSEETVRTGSGTEPQAVDATAGLAAEKGRRRPRAAIRPVVPSGVRPHPGSPQWYPEVGPTVAPEVLPAATPPVDRREGPSQEPPTIKVHIGRIEVRAAPPNSPASPRKPLRPRRPALSLDGYLKRRSGGSR